MPRITANGIEIEYDTTGRADDRPLLLIMGLGAQMIMWDEEFCELLAGYGHHVIRYDARDTGLSSKFEEAGTPDIPAMMAAVRGGAPANAPYLLKDMADDAAALLGELGIDAAHVVGASMGGMVAQELAIRHAERVLSLTSIMSTTGNPSLPPARPEAIARLMQKPQSDREGYLSTFVESMKILFGSGFPFDEARTRERGERLYDRAYYPAGQTRHLAAVLASGSRREALESVVLPALVIHGKDDPLVPVEGGIDTHEALKDSELMLIDGLGHGLPPEVHAKIAQAIADLTAR